MNIPQIHQLFMEKKLTVRELVLQCFEKIAEIDKGEDGLNSVLELNPEALVIADKLDAQMDAAADKSLIFNEKPMFGIPILLKDNINTADRMRTSAGSVALADNYAPYDACVAVGIREAGAVIIGKANCTEFSNWMSEGMPSGYSSRGGQTLNPFNRDETPSGSSSGSAVAVSAGLCQVAVGTETCGSIISPSIVNGIVGIKPTAGLLSGRGIIPISFTLDTSGPMARTVTDAAFLLSAMASNGEDYTDYLDKDGLNGMRIGISYDFIKEDDDVGTRIARPLLDDLTNLMKNNGAACIQLPKDALNEDDIKLMDILKYEFKNALNHYLATLKNPVLPKNLQEVIVYNQNHAAVALKHGQSILTDCQNNASGNLTEPAYIEAILNREGVKVRFDGVFAQNNVDVILVVGGFTSLPPYTGFPSVTVPIGQKPNNIPIGAYFMAKPNNEATLIKAAYAVEQLMKLGGLRLQAVGLPTAEKPAII
jgi:amidase